MEGELEVVWDKSDVVHMDDAMAVPATGGFYKSVAHHFYEVHCTSTACEQLLCILSAATFGTSK